MNEEVKRLFFGIEVVAPWPENYPKGRLLEASHRHMTLAFLGNVPAQKVLDLLPDFPPIPLKIGLAGRFDRCLFLPPHHPHVVAWHVDWIDDPRPFLEHQSMLALWLRSNGFHIDEREFLPHVTICRSPFYPREWKKEFHPLPCFCKDIHLYESVGNLKYEPRWSLPLKAPFEEIEHTADIAFAIHGESISQLHRHAQLALAFRFPLLLNYLEQCEVGSLEDCVIALNEIVTRADGDIGCPFKAISFHGELYTETDGTLTWEMIVDV